MSVIKNYGVCVVCNNWKHTFTLHKFPSDLEQRRLWLKKIGMHEKDLKRNVKICSIHFKVSCFIGIRKKILAPGSIPTKFPPGRGNKKFTCPSTFKRYKNIENKTLWICKVCKTYVEKKENVWTHLTTCNKINPYFDSKVVLRKEEDKVLKQSEEFVFVSSQYPKTRFKMTFEGHDKRTQTQRNCLLKRGYTITGRIGKGGFGVVLMARSSRHHAQMAIKVVEKSLETENCAALHWSINNELQFAELFGHPYINAYHEIIETTKRLYLVMDYYPDGTLLDYYHEVEHTAEPEAYRWFAQLCSALGYVHACGFAHRDVKMDNLLLDRQRRIRLADFGMCVAVKRPTSRGRGVASREQCGTSLYMSPELLAHGPYHGQLADVWAAGVLLYCLVTGRFPFSAHADGCTDDVQLVMESQKEGYSFNPNEKQRLSVECQSFFGNIFVNEKDRKEIKELTKVNWMVKMSSKIQVPFCSRAVKNVWTNASL